MTTSAIPGFGVILSFDGTAIAEITDLSGPGLSLDTMDVTSHDSLNAYREFLGSLIDSGEVSLSLNLIPSNAGHVKLRASLTTRTAKAVVITWPDGTTTWSFTGLVTAFEPSAPLEDPLACEVTIKVSGSVTFSV